MCVSFCSLYCKMKLLLFPSALYTYITVHWKCKLYNLLLLLHYNGTTCVSFCFLNQGWQFGHGFLRELLVFCERKSESVIRSFFEGIAQSLFFKIDVSKSLMVTLLLWATWATCSWLLFYSEWPLRFAHGRSFKKNNWGKSDRSDSLFGIKRGENSQKHTKIRFFERKCD